MNNIFLLLLKKKIQILLESLVCHPINPLLPLFLFLLPFFLSFIVVCFLFFSLFLKSEGGGGEERRNGIKLRELGEGVRQQGDMQQG